MHMILYEDIVKNEEIKQYIENGDKVMESIGYTEHSFYHAVKTSNDASMILKRLGYSKREVELVRIAAYMHDIGNIVNRVDHAQSGALMAFNILSRLKMDPEEIALIVGAIGNHDEGTGTAINPISAALILADKSDVRRSRVRKRELHTFDKHDRVNYAVEASTVFMNDENTHIMLKLQIDINISPVMDYFEIFLSRMLMCKKAAELLGCKFALIINDSQLL